MPGPLTCECGTLLVLAGHLSVSPSVCSVTHQLAVACSLDDPNTEHFAKWHDAVDKQEACDHCSHFNSACGRLSTERNLRANLFRVKTSCMHDHHSHASTVKLAAKSLILQAADALDGDLANPLRHSIGLESTRELVGITSPGIKQRLYCLQYQCAGPAASTHA